MRTPSRILAGLLVAMALCVVAPGSASAQNVPLSPPTVAPPSTDKPPPGFKISLVEAFRIAGRLPQVQRERAKDPTTRGQGSIPVHQGGVRRVAQAQEKLAVVGQ